MNEVEPTPAEALPGEGVLVIGGGRVGRELARQFPRLTILESDPAKIERIQKSLSKGRIVLGSGSNPDHLTSAGVEEAKAVIIVTNTDESNYKCARVVRKLAPKAKVMARVDDESNIPRFQALRVEPVVSPLATAASQVANLLEPNRRSIVECVLTDDSPVVGNLVAELPISSQTNVISILRDDHLMPAMPETKLEAGDVLTLITLDEKTEVLSKISGRETGINPLSRIYVPLVSEASLMESFKEAFVLAQRTQATIYIVCAQARHELADEARRLAQLQQVKVHVHLVEGDPVDALAKIIESYDAANREQRRVRGLVFDGVAVDRDALPRLWQRPLFKSTAERVIESVPDHPVLVAAQGKPYKSIFLVVDQSDSTRVRVAYAIDLALTYNCKIVALTIHGAETPRSHVLLQYLKRTGRVFGLEVEEHQVKGNPALEVVLEVKRGHHDLVILSWRSMTVKRDFVKRIIRRAPQSVLVVP